MPTAGNFAQPMHYRLRQEVIGPWTITFHRDINHQINEYTYYFDVVNNTQATVYLQGYNFASPSYTLVPTGLRPTEIWRFSVEDASDDLRVMFGLPPIHAPRRPEPLGYNPAGVAFPPPVTQYNRMEWALNELRDGADRFGGNTTRTWQRWHEEDMRASKAPKTVTSDSSGSKRSGFGKFSKQVG